MIGGIYSFDMRVVQYSQLLFCRGFSALGVVIKQTPHDGLLYTHTMCRSSPYSSISPLFQLARPFSLPPPLPLSLPAGGGKWTTKAPFP